MVVVEKDIIQEKSVKDEIKGMLEELNIISICGVRSDVVYALQDGGDLETIVGSLEDYLKDKNITLEELRVELLNHYPTAEQVHNFLTRDVECLPNDISLELDMMTDSYYVITQDVADDIRQSEYYIAVKKSNEEVSKRIEAICDINSILRKFNIAVIILLFCSVIALLIYNSVEHVLSVRDFIGIPIIAIEFYAVSLFIFDTVINIVIDVKTSKPEDDFDYTYCKALNEGL